MEVLIDIDIFVKLSVCNLLEEFLKLNGNSLSTCGRLESQQYMVRKGDILEFYGEKVCGVLASITKLMPTIDNVDDALLSELLSIHDIDPGEAIIFAKAIQDKLELLTGDKRALCALKNHEDYTTRLNGQIVILEAALLRLCINGNETIVQSTIRSTKVSDTVMGICFSVGNSHSIECLKSYFGDAEKMVKPLKLWNPN